MKIAVGMSGGVDSSVAAFLLRQQGHSVIGLTMKIWRDDMPLPALKGNACYGPGEKEDIEETARFCASLDIPYHVIDCSADYERIVLDYFRSEYRSGRTPNPCVRCNQEVKFGVLPALAKQAGIAFDLFATGHYARIERDRATGRFVLRRGIDTGKDQSYFIYRLSQEQLATTLFPLGGMRKSEVRAIAKQAGLPVHDKEESQDFYAGNYGDLIGEADRPGDIVDGSGRKLGVHRGIWNYTIGQRKGLGIAWSEPLYVVCIDVENNRVVVGTGSETGRTGFVVTDCAWSAISSPDATLSAAVKIRSATHPVEATLEPLDGTTVRVTFMIPHQGITPGQSAVFYCDDTVLGGGIIDYVAA